MYQIKKREFAVPDSDIFILDIEDNSYPIPILILTLCV